MWIYGQPGSAAVSNVVQKASRLKIEIKGVESSYSPQTEVYSGIQCAKSRERHVGNENKTGFPIPHASSG